LRSYLDMGKLDEAATQFEIAANKNASSAIVNANMGALQVSQNDYEKAYATLGQVSGGSNEVSSKVSAMKGAIEVQMGEYGKAKASFNAASLNDAANLDKGLAYLLDGDLTQANGALAQVSEDGELAGIAAYLMAVSAARDGNAVNVGTSLKKAIDADPSLKSKALSDLEFANFANAVNEAVK
ncbi:MAG: tetratricopeptide repeat protein, partial [Bacteroidota bacterium]